MGQWLTTSYSISDLHQDLLDEKFVYRVELRHFAAFSAKVIIEVDLPARGSSTARVADVHLDTL